ncbi:MAG: serine/threonine-protein kinase, partial [Planctomycetota bacterium]
MMTSTLDSLPVEDQRKIEALCTRFEDTQPAADRDIRGLLDEVSEDQRGVLLQELIVLDMELRHCDGESPKLSDYESLLEAIPESFRQRFSSAAGWSIPHAGGELHAGGDLGRGDEPPISQRYEFLERIGRGGIGEVWRVFDRHSQRNLAIKMLRPNFRRDPEAILRFQREAILTGKLQHPGVPPVHDRGKLEDGSEFFAMKLVEGHTLESLLRKRDQKASDLGEHLDVFEQVAQTLAYAHSEQTIHRDLKPANIMVGRFGEVHVMDWGFAKRVGELDDITPAPGDTGMTNRDTAERFFVPEFPDDTPGTSNLTRTGDIVGTPSYMSPEQARGDHRNIDARADVFSLGCMLFQMLTQQLPHRGDSYKETLAKAAAGKLDKALQTLDQIDGHAALIQLCTQCLQADPDHRPADGSAVADAMRDYKQQVQEQVRLAEIEQERSRVQTAETIKRQNLFFVLATAIALVGLVGALAFGVQWNQATIAAGAAIAAKQQAESESVALGQVNDFLISVLESPMLFEDGGDLRLREVIDKTLPELDGRLDDRPEIEGRIRSTVGETYRWLGEYDQSIEQLRLAMDCFDRVDDPLHEGRFEVMDRLAGSLRTRGEKDEQPEAYALRKAVLDHRLAVHGELHPATLHAMNNLSTVLVELGQVEQATRLLQKGLALADQLKDPLEYDPIAMMQNLMSCHAERQQDKQAKEMVDQIVQLCEAPEDPRRTNAQVVLGQMYHDMERYDEAIEYLQPGLLGRAKLFGPEHPHTMSATRKLCRAMVAAGRFQEALPRLSDSIARHNRVEGSTAGITFGVRKEMAKALLGLGRNEQAIEFM